MPQQQSSLLIATLFSLLSCTHAQPPRIYSLHIGLQVIDSAAYKKKYDREYNTEATAGVPSDLKRMSTIGKRYDHHITTLINHQATRNNIKKAIQQIGKIIRKDDLFILYYSGHGDTLKDINGDEKSGYDQVLVAYDDYVVDDELNSLFVQYFRETKNIMIVDACHSGTTYQYQLAMLDFMKIKTANYVVDKALAQQRDLLSTCTLEQLQPIASPFPLIYFGATEDDDVAAGDEDGGLLTSKLFRIYKNAYADGTWKKYNYRKLACELRESMHKAGQDLQYYELGKNVLQYSTTLPFKIQQP